MSTEAIKESSSQFLGEFDPARFFAGGSCAGALADIEGALRDQVGIITLIGDEGRGKSVLCKMVQSRWRGCDKIIYLPRALKSFEDIVRVVARECDLESLAESNGADTKKIFMDLVSALRIRGETILLICDEAEKMYPATFERIRKTLDEVNRQGGGLQLLFSGRKRLGGYFEQLRLCDFEKVAEREVLLSDWNGKEVQDYLNFLLQTSPGSDQGQRFSRRAADWITTLACGNVRMVNEFGDEALQAAVSDASSLVLLKHVKEDDIKKESQPGTSVKLYIPDFLGRLPFSPRYLMGGAVLLCVLLLLFVFSRDDDQEIVKDEQAVKESVASTTSTQLAAARGPEVDGSAGKQREKEKDDDKTLAPAVSNAPEPQEKVSPAKEGGGQEVTEAAPEEKNSGQEVFHGQVKEAVEERETVPDPPSTPSQPAQPEFLPVDISPVEVVESEDGGSQVLESEDGGSQVLELKGKSKIPWKGSTDITDDSVKEVPQKAVVEAPPAWESGLASLLAGGKRWQDGDKRDEFTIQLMALASEQAEENLKRILSQPDYQTVAHKLVMLKRPSNPPLILVYYGLYPSMAAARNARNNMPIFLRKHHPYAISIKSAVEKSESE